MSKKFCFLLTNGQMVRMDVIEKLELRDGIIIAWGMEEVSEDQWEGREVIEPFKNVSKVFTKEVEEK